MVKSFILASASPRRKELLEKAGCKFKIVVSNVDEGKISANGLTPAEFASCAALLKAEDVAAKFPDELIVGSDTVADYDGEIIGKANSAADARQIVEKLFSRPHKIITAIAMVRKSVGLKMVEFDTTVVYPKKLSPQQLAAHIASMKWLDKAGAYAIQEDGDEFIEKIEGSITNVMGFSMELFEKMFQKASGI